VGIAFSAHMGLLSPPLVFLFNSKGYAQHGATIIIV